MRYQDVIKQSSVYLNQSQREFYYDQGYLVLPSLISQSDLDDLRQPIAEIIEKSRKITQSSRQLDLEKGHCAENPKLRRVAYIDDEYPVFWDLCADLVGPNVRFRELMLNFEFMNENPS